MYDQLNNRPNIKKRNSYFKPVIDSCFIVRWLRLHVFNNLLLSLCRQIFKKDLYNLSEDFYPEVQYGNFLKQRERRPNWTFGMIIFLKLMTLPLIVGSILGAAAAALGYSGPLFIKQIMKFMNDTTPQSHQQRRAYKYAGLWLSMYFLRMLCNELSQWVCHSVAIKVQQILNLTIYDKLMKMSTTYRRYLDQGDFITFFQIDSKLIFNFIKSFYVLSSAPTTLIMAQIFVCIEVGAYGICLILTILFSLILQLLIDRHVAKLTLRKLKYYSDRLTCNLEMLSSLKQIKSLGWEELISLKNREYRRIENRYNFKSFIYNSLYTFIVNFAPPLSIFLIFVIDIAISGQSKFQTTHIFTVITYIGLIQTPLNTLPSTIILGLETIACCRRIQHLLHSQQAKNMQTYALSPGVVVIRNLVGRWDSEQSIKHHTNKDAEFAKKFLKSKEQQLPTTYRNVLESGPSERAFEVGSTDLVLNIPFRVELGRGERLIVIGEVGSTREGLIDAFLGHLNILEGQMRYGGKIGYLPQSPFLKHDTIRNNILFGQPLDQEKLKRVIKLVGIDQELGHLQKYDSAVLQQISTLISLSDRQRIVLARNLYYDPDIFLFDNFFDQIDTSSFKLILDIFQKQIPNKTLIISTKNRNFMKPLDKVLIFQETIAVQYGYLNQLIQNPHSYVHYWRQRRINIIQEIQPLGRNKLAPEFSRQQAIKRKGHMMRKNLDGKSKSYREEEAHMETGQVLKSHKRDTVITRGTLPSGTISNNIQSMVQKPTTTAPPVPPPPPSPATAMPAARPKGVQLKFYWKFIRSGSLIIYLLVAGLLALGQGMNIFSVWWIGHAKVQFRYLSSAAVIGIYIGLVLGYGFTLLVVGVLIPFQSLINTESLARTITQRIERVDLGWAEKQNKAYIAGTIGRDNDEMFIINNYMTNTLLNIFFYIGTMILSGYENWMIFILGGVVMVVNWIFVMIYIRAQRQQTLVGISLLKQYDTLLQDFIFGVDSIRALNKTSHNRQLFMDNLYCYSAVYKANYRWLSQALSMFSDITGIGVTYGTMMIIIKRKINHTERFNIVGASISLANKLNSIFISISNGLANLEAQIRATVKVPLVYAVGNFEQAYDQPKPPEEWPVDSSIRVERVTFKHDQYKEPSLNQVTFQSEPGERIMMLEKLGGTGVESLFMLINKLRQPTQNTDKSRGFVIIGKFAHQQIGSKYLRKKVMLLDSYPFILSATLRQNVDPFKQYTDQQIRDALIKVGLWQQIPIEQSIGFHQTQAKLNFRVKDAGGNISLGHQQLINISRAVLAKPKILMRDFMATAVSIKQRNLIRKLTFEEMPETTILLSSLDTLSAIQANRIIYFEDGEIVEEGDPRRLLGNPRSEFSRVVREIDPVLYKHIILGTIPEEEY